MEIRLNCFNSVELNGFTKLKNIMLEIISYNLNGNVLSGDVKTTGEYYKQNDVVYYCIRDTGNPVYNNLSDLIDIYVEVAH